jgi:hypothetical protein
MQMRWLLVGCLILAAACSLLVVVDRDQIPLGEAGAAGAAGAAGVAGTSGAAGSAGAAGAGGAAGEPFEPPWTGEGRWVFIQAECAHGPSKGDCDGQIQGAHSGTQLENDDTTVGRLMTGDYLMYSGIELSGLNVLYVRYATESNGTIEVRLDSVDGEQTGLFEPAYTGSWTRWADAMIPLDPVSGVHDLYLVGKEMGGWGIANLDWLVLGSCTRDCRNKDCGDDGCGGVCGACGPSEECSPEEQCSVCEPVCEGKTCGDDTCGGLCGTCADGETCTAERTCVAYETLGGPPRVHVDGAVLRDPEDNVVVLRGVSLIDVGQQHVWRTGGITRALDRVTEPGWETQIVRFPVYTASEPYPFSLTDRVEREEYMTEVLRPAVDYATELGLYVIIDLHEISSVTTRKDQDTRLFWSYMASQFADYPNVIYELYNEPIDVDWNCLAGETDECWPPFKEKAQRWVVLVRQGAADTLLLVGGPVWSQIIGPAADDPIDDDHVAYVSHVYPWNYESGEVEAQIRRCAAVHPVMLTEWGYEGEEPEYAEVVRALMDELGLSWTAWAADFQVEPPMFDRYWEPTHFGATVRDWLAEAAP